mgnify:FL=1
MTIPESAPTWAALAIIGIIAAVLYARSPKSGEGPPEDAVHRMVKAANNGDIRAYLDCFEGELSARLRAARKEFGDQRFSNDIRQRVAGMTGIAISRASPEEAGGEPAVAALRVEQVFRDRNEVQIFRLRRSRGVWRIKSMGSAATVQMPIPYGTPVYPPEPPSAPARP